MDHSRTTTPDAITLLTGQHREVEQLWSQLQSSIGGDREHRQDLARQIVTKLSQHDAIETRMLYPELKDLDGGKPLADHSLDEHQHIRELLKEVDGEDPADPEVFATFERCMREVTGHVQEEEGQVFPKLRTGCDQAALDDLGRRMADALPNAPTHPHPSTPNNKVGATVAGAVAGVVDKARDTMSGRRS